jgi:hypothetical protein
MTHRQFTIRLSLIVLSVSAAFLVWAASYADAASPACHDDRPACAGKPACAAEDLPCWTWSIHGNQRRGIITKPSRSYPHGAFRVVGVCGFQRLYHARRIDWKRTERLRGDWTALHSFDCD